MSVAIDKNKILDQAQKYVAKGQIEKAISEYLKVVEADPKDQRTRLKIGELYLKEGKKTAAVNEYSAVAAFYASDGFNLQAIAVFKQLLKIDPSITEAYVKLAELYKKQGLIADALAQFRIVISNYEKHGKTTEALDALKQMASMDPENFSIRAKIADLHLKGGNKKEAMEEYSAIADDLKNKGRIEDVIILFERLLSTVPSSTFALQGIGEAYLKIGKKKEAFNSLQAAIKLDPKDTKARSLLAEVYLATGDDKNVKLTYEEILKIDQSYDDARKGLAKLLIKEKNFKEGMEIAFPFVDKALEQNNYDGALDILLEFYRNEVREHSLLEKMADTYRLKGEKEKEIAIREEITNLTKPLWDVVKAQAPVKKPEPVVSLEAEPELLELDEVPVEEPPVEKHIVLEEEPEAEAPAEDVQTYLTQADVYIKYGLKDKAMDILNTALSLFPGDKEVLEQLASLGAEPSVEEEALEEISPDVELHEEAPLDIETAEEISIDVEEHEEAEIPEMEDIHEIEVEVEHELEVPSEAAISTLEVYPPSRIKADLEEADFYIQQGLYEDARNICNRILELLPGSDDALLKLKAIDMAENPEPSAPVTSAQESPVESFFDLAAELDSAEMESLAMPPGMREAEKVGFEDIFSEFKKGVDSQLEKEDTETHYNLGIAYKEMGLIDDAIREFKIASADPNKEYDCYNLMGICYIEKGAPQKAVEVFKKCLEYPGRSNDEYASINYELGMAYELSGSPQEALAAYMEAEKKNPDFRDLQSKISLLGGSRETKKGRVSYV